MSRLDSGFVSLQDIFRYDCTRMLSHAKIPRGNTCPGVNRAIIENLLSRGEAGRPLRFLDIPCGEGAFLNAVAAIFPRSETVGCDIRIPSKSFPHRFIAVDASEGVKLDNKGTFDVIACISGVMEFDNTLQFFKEIRQYLSHQGLLFVTNDNTSSLQDRLLYLLFGRWRQYRLFNEPGEATWKLVTIQSLLRILTDAEFVIEDVQYVPSTARDLLWIPLALPIYLCQRFHMGTARSSLSREERRRLFPFRALYSRHYILICSRQPEPHASAQ